MLQSTHMLKDKQNILLWVLLFGIMGAISVLIIRASSVNESFEAETGSLSAPAIRDSDEDASNSQYVQFGVQQADGIFYGANLAINASNTDGCTVEVPAEQSINDAISSSTEGAVICVATSSRLAEEVNINIENLTLRAVGDVQIRNAVLNANGVTIEGFSIKGQELNNPSVGIQLNAQNQTVQNNRIDGRPIRFGVRCFPDADCTGSVIANNTINNIQGIGIRVNTSSIPGGVIIERNNIYDIWRSQAGIDVTAIRIFGQDHIIRNNYIHDINEHKSEPKTAYDDDSGPHIDCIHIWAQPPNPINHNILIEDNYCMRITRVFVIAQNNGTPGALRNLTVRDNVAMTFAHQVILLGSSENSVVENNMLIGGTRSSIVALEENNGVQNSNVIVRNNAALTGLDWAVFLNRIATPIDEVAEENNVTVHDPNIMDIDYNHRIDNDSDYPEFVAEDFTVWREYAAQMNLSDQGLEQTRGDNSFDVDGAQRLQGPAIDIGPWEFQ